MRNATTLRIAQLVGIASSATLFVLIAIQQQNFPFHIRSSIKPSDVTSTGGYGYQLHLGKAHWLLWATASDRERRPTNSSLRMLENGKDFGIAHSNHVDISGIGLGRYSHWRENLYFSTPDNSDPRSNGRRYEVDGVFHAPHWLARALAILAFLSFTIAFYAKRSGQPDVTSARKTDLWCILALVGLAGLQTFLLLGACASPVIVPSTDGGNISAWVAGRLEPERFSSDFLLSNSANTSFYPAVVLNSIGVLGSLFGDIGLAYLFMYLPIACLLLTGFYILGRVFVESQVASVLLALLVSCPILIWGYNDLFGMYFVPLTRTAYDAILPFLIAAFVCYGKEARYLPLLAGLVGLSFYVHPVSAPSIAAGLLMGGIALKPPGESIWRRLSYLSISGLVFLLVAAPYALAFMTSFSGGLAHQAPELSAAMDAFRELNGKLFYDALLALRMFVEEISPTWYFWLIGLAGLVLIPFVDPSKAVKCRFLLLFLFGCVLASFGLCLADQFVSRQLGRPPFQLDLIRGLRFAVVPLILGFVLVIDQMQSLLRSRWGRDLSLGATNVAALLVVLIWWSQYPNWLGDRLGLAPIPTWAQPLDRDASAMMNYFKTQPVDGTVLPLGKTEVGLAIRYAGRQPVAFLSKDANALFYSGSNLRLKWHQLDQLRSKMASGGQEAFSAFRELWRQSKASHLVLQAGFLNPSIESQIQSEFVVIGRWGAWAVLRPSKAFEDGARNTRS